MSGNPASPEMCQKLRDFVVKECRDYSTMLAFSVEASGALAMMYLSIVKSVEASTAPEDLKQVGRDHARTRILRALTIARQLVESANPEVLAEAMGLEMETIHVPNPHYRPSRTHGG